MSLRQTVTNDDLMVMPLDEILRLRPENMAYPIISQAAFERIGGLLKAFWRYEGDPDPARPHAKLTGGACSNLFINAGLILSYTRLNALFAASLAEIIKNGLGIPGPNTPVWTMGSDHAAAVFASWVAYFLDAERYDFTEKSGADGKEQKWTRHELPEGTKPGQVEELITTLATVERVRAGVRAFHKYPIEFAWLATLVHRPDKSKFQDKYLWLYEGKKVIANYTYDGRNYDPKKGEVCPYCAVGSPAIESPKQNWARLVGG